MNNFRRAVFSAVLVLSFVSLSSEVALAEKLRALYGDGSVRVASAGPVLLSNDHNALIGLLLPAVQKARATIHFVDDDGDVLATKIVDIPTDQIPTDQREGGFWGIKYTLAVSSGGVISITDGTNQETIGDLTSSEHVSVLIGLLLPAVQKVREAANRMHTGSIQIVDRTNQLITVMPFVEQAVVAKNLEISSR